MSFLDNYIKRVKLFYSEKIHRALLIVVVFSITAVILVFNFSLKVAERSLFEQMLHREQVVAHAGALSLENFLEVVSNQVSLYSTRKNILSLSDLSDFDLQQFILTWGKEHLINEAVILDKNGKVIVNKNFSEIDDIGTDLSDREYFKILKVSNDPTKVFTSKPIISKVGATKGENIIVVSASIYDETEFKGVFAVAISISDFADKYLLPLKLTDDTRIYLISSDGNIIYSPWEQLLGINYFKYLEDKGYKDYKNVFNILSKILNDKTESKFDIYLPSEENFIPTRYLIAESPISYRQDDSWMLVVAIPADKALDFMGPFISYNSIFLYFGVFLVLIFSAFILTVVKIIKKNESKSV